MSAPATQQQQQRRPHVAPRAAPRITVDCEGSAEASPGNAAVALVALVAFHEAGVGATSVAADEGVAEGLALVVADADPVPDDEPLCERVAVRLGVRVAAWLSDVACDADPLPDAVTDGEPVPRCDGDECCEGEPVVLPLWLGLGRWLALPDGLPLPVTVSEAEALCDAVADTEGVREGDGVRDRVSDCEAVRRCEGVPEGDTLLEAVMLEEAA